MRKIFIKNSEWSLRCSRLPLHEENRLIFEDDIIEFYELCTGNPVDFIMSYEVEADGLYLVKCKCSLPKSIAMNIYVGAKSPDKNTRGNLHLLFTEQPNGEYLCTSQLKHDIHPSVGKRFSREVISHDLSLGYLKVFLTPN